MQSMVSFFVILGIGHCVFAKQKQLFLDAAMEKNPGLPPIAKLVELTITNSLSKLGLEDAPTLKCVGWKKTLNCDPSGPRDTVNDKDCSKTVSSEESGFCECGDFKVLNDTQFAAVPCTHPPFTCDAMCLKLSVLSGISIDYKGSTMNSTEANTTLEALQKNPYALDILKQRERPPPIQDAMKAFAKTKAAEVETHTADVAKHSAVAQKEVEEMMKQNSRAWEDVHLIADEMRHPGGEPVWKNLATAARQMKSAGQKMQDTVKTVLPWDAAAGPPPFR